MDTGKLRSTFTDEVVNARSALNGLRGILISLDEILEDETAEQSSVDSLVEKINKDLRNIQGDLGSLFSMINDIVKSRQ